MSAEVPSDWQCPEADERGLVSLDLLGERAGELGLEAFVERYPVPGLLVVYREPEGGEEGDFASPFDSGIQLLTVTVKSPAILQYLNQVAFVTKRPGNPYSHLVSIGRSANNDIVIAVDTLSKLHGYFSREGDGWSFTDHGSTNGSKLNDRSLQGAEKHPLGDGDVLELGLGVFLEYLGPRKLYERARSLRA